MENNNLTSADFDFTNFANKLRDLRHFNKKTQKEIASNLNISVTCYAGYEQGYRCPNLETLSKIANYFNISTDFLLGQETTKQQEKIGKIETGYFFRQYVGEGKTEDGTEFELCLSASSSAPIVICGKRAFILSWNDILNLAERAGLFKTEG